MLIALGGGGEELILALHFGFRTPCSILCSDVSAKHAGSVYRMTGFGSGEYCCNWEYEIFQLCRMVLPESI